MQVNRKTKSFTITNSNRQETNSPKRLPKTIRYFNRAWVLALLMYGIYSVFFNNNQNQIEIATSLNSSSSGFSLSSEENSKSITNKTDSNKNVVELRPLNQPSDKEIEDEKLPEIADKNKNKIWENQSDTSLAHYLNILLNRYQPDGAFYLVVDIETNEILAWGQRSDSTIQENPTYLSMSPFPAASLIKAITAGAAMEYNRYGLNSKIPLIGSLHKLYKTQLKVPKNYKGPTMTLENAFAKSANPIFGIIGKELGGKRMTEFGKQMGFNTNWPNKTPNRSNFSPPNSGYALAEAASGFTTKNTISPLLAAAITRAIVSGKPLTIPYSKNIGSKYAPIKSVAHPDGKSLKDNTLYGLRKMFLKTVSHGTSRNSMKKTLYSYNFKRLDVGGKTGTLDGKFPTKVRYDWFMGFAKSKKEPTKACAVVVMQYHQDKRTESSSKIAGLIINKWAKDRLD